MIKKSLPLFFLLFTFVFSVRLMAQVEYFIKVNPLDGTFEKINKLDGVKWILTLPNYFGFDESRHQYFFAGSNQWNIVNHNLNFVDVDAGIIVKKPILPDNQYDRLICDSSTGKIYGLNNNQLVEVNSDDGSSRLISTIPNIGYVTSHNTFDKENHHYILESNNRIITVDVISGNVVYDFPLNGIPNFGNFVELEFHNGQVYGLITGKGKLHLVKVDHSTGLMSDIVSLPVSGVDMVAHYTIMDQKNHIYYFYGTNKRLYGVNVDNGEIVSDPLFPVLDDPDDNVLGLCFDNKTQTIYALHWDMRDENFPAQSINPQADELSGCAPFVVQFHANPENVDEVYWYAATGDENQHSIEMNPTFTFSTPGLHTIEVEGFFVDRIERKTLTIRVIESPIADFNYTIQDSIVSFVNSSSNEYKIKWLFDSTEIVTDEDTISYSFTPGNHMIQLTAIGKCGENDSSVNIYIEEPGKPDVPKSSIKITFYSNPTFDLFKFDIKPIENRVMKMIFYDALGKKVLIKNFITVPEKTYEVHLVNFAAGTYFYQLFVNDEIYTGKVVKLLKSK